MFLADPRHWYARRIVQRYEVFRKYHLLFRAALWAIMLVRLAAGFVTTVLLTFMLSNQPYQPLIRMTIIVLFAAYVYVILPVSIKMALLLTAGWAIDMADLLESKWSEAAGSLFWRTGAHSLPDYWKGRYDKLRTLRSVHKDELAALAAACPCRQKCGHRRRLDIATRQRFELQVLMSTRRAAYELRGQLQPQLAAPREYIGSERS